MPKAERDLDGAKVNFYFAIFDKNKKNKKPNIDKFVKFK